MNETKTEWRDCADPDELAAAVAAGVEVEVQRRVGQPWQPTRSIAAAQFAGFISTGHRYRLPTSWRPEPPAPDDLAARARRHAYTHPESRHIIEELLDEVEMLRHSVDVATDAAPVPPWPGAVLSGLVDEDGVPTWLALAPNVLGEAVRTCIDFPWFICGSDNAVTPYWVEVRAPRAVPEPETERVPWWKAKDRNGLAGDPFVEVGSDDEGPWVRVVEGGTKLYSPVAPDGTVEVLKDGES